MRPSHRRSAVADYLIIIIVACFIGVQFTLYYIKRQVFYCGIGMPAVASPITVSIILSALVLAS